MVIGGAGVNRAVYSAVGDGADYGEAEDEALNEAAVEPLEGVDQCGHESCVHRRCDASACGLTLAHCSNTVCSHSMQELFNAF